MDKPLTADILSNPHHKITKHIIYLYSMESFIYKDLNKACRDKDMSSIKYYGAFATTLSYILSTANIKRKKYDFKEPMILYRGLKMTKENIDMYEPGKEKHLTGYTSTSKNVKNALRFAILDLKENQVAVIF